MRNSLLLYINGQPCRVEGQTAFMSLANFLRYERGATGTKIVCEEGDCGACSVLVGRAEQGKLVYQPINSCIQFLYQLDCAHIITVEGLKMDNALHAVQTAMVEHHGAQCGYCTPGFVVSMCAMFQQGTEKPSCQEVRDGLTGNLCRCTGYEPIIRAALNVDENRVTPLETLYPSEGMLKAFEAAQAEPVLIQAEERTFYKPVSLESAVEFKASHPETVIISGGTDLGVQCNKRGIEPASILSTAHLPDLDTLRAVTDAAGREVLEIGARVSLSVLERFVELRIPQFFKILNVFGAPQIKNAGTLAGNIANGSPIGDSIPLLMVMDAEVEVLGEAGLRRININRLYKGYRTLDLKPDELITRIWLPVPSPAETLRLYKVSRRKHLDISAFTAAIRLTIEDGRIQSARLAYGGVGPVVLRLRETEAFLTGQPVNESIFREAGKLARQEVTPISDVRGSSGFRSQLAENMLLKFYLETQEAEALCQP